MPQSIYGYQPARHHMMAQRQSNRTLLKKAADEGAKEITPTRLIGALYGQHTPHPRVIEFLEETLGLDRSELFTSDALRDSTTRRFHKTRVQK